MSARIGKRKKWHEIMNMSLSSQFEKPTTRQLASEDGKETERAKKKTDLETGRRIHRYKISGKKGNCSESNGRVRTLDDRPLETADVFWTRVIKEMNRIGSRPD